VAKSVAPAIRELVVIVMGVMIALAADRWVETLRDRSLESDYRTRLSEDVADATASLESRIERFESAAAALEALLDVESSEFPTDSIVSWYLNASHLGTGFSDRPFVTFGELVSTGQLSLLSDPKLRRSVSRFFLDLEELNAGIEAMVPLNTQTARLTGLLPFRARRADLDAETRRRVAARATSESSQGELRLLRAQITFQLGRMERLRERAIDLSVDISSSGGGSV
jgi:hypothetical protein